MLAVGSTTYARAGLEKMRDWARTIEREAAKALAALYLLESANVEIVEGGAVIERRDARRAEKRGWPKADTGARAHPGAPARDQRPGVRDGDDAAGAPSTSCAASTST